MPLPDLLQPLLDDPARSCLLCDFDGTISAIVADPADAVALAGAPEALAQLAERLDCVALISGRPVAWLADRLGAVASEVELHGIYGLETWRNGAPVAVREAEPWRPVIDRIATAAAAAAPESVLVESKGLSVGLHYRGDPSDETWVTRWADEQVEAHGVSLLTGRLAVELRPPIDRDKGSAAAELLERRQPSVAVFLGDDTGDVPVAAALRDYAARTGARTVVVCVDSDETPEAMREVADLHVAGPTAAIDLLTALAAALITSEG